jgi:hypothetical protein
MVSASPVPALSASAAPTDTATANSFRCIDPPRVGVPFRIRTPDCEAVANFLRTP